MSVGISSLAYAVRKASESSSQPLNHGHAQQLVAAALGYQSLAAYQAAVAAGKECEHLDAAAYIVLDEDSLVERATELKLPQPEAVLIGLVRATFKSELPDAALHRTEDALADAVREYVDSTAYNHSETGSEMAATNNDGVREIYLPLDFSLADLPPPGESLEVEIDGHISMEPDIERPYSGHKIDVRGKLFLERIGRVAMAEPVFRLEHARLDYDWGARDDEPPKVPLAQALAEELGITQEEAKELVDVEPLAIDSNDDMVYGYVFDFSEVASPSVEAKLMAKYQSLQVRVPLWFFDRVARET